MLPWMRQLLVHYEFSRILILGRHCPLHYHFFIFQPLLFNHPQIIESASLSQSEQRVELLEFIEVKSKHIFNQYSIHMFPRRCTYIQ